MKEFNNADIRFYTNVKDYEMLRRIHTNMDAKQITQTCSPLHVQSVIEDMQNVIARLLDDLGTKENQQ